MNKKQKLELTWIGKDERPKLEPRILIEDPELSHHADKRYGDNDIFDNILIQGDNLLALKALEQKYIGKVKCIFIDPPYNTGAAFEHYEDGLEHSIWLGLIRDRVELLRKFLREDGSLWITIDHNECHYLKVVCDEIFGRENFVANIVWQKRTSPDFRASIGAAHDDILVYAKNKSEFKDKLNKLPRSDEQLSGYSNPDNDPRGPWASTDLTGQTGRATKDQFYEIVTPSGQRYPPPEGRCWALNQSTFLEMQNDGRIWFGQNGDSRPRKKKFLSEADGVASWSWWPNNEVGHNQEAKRESNTLFTSANSFETPKPERLLHRIILLASDEGDIVMDSFGGSGTTAAVAHKMRRKWIMVELGHHAQTHIVPRIKKVIEAKDDGGVTEATGWKGGGGYNFFHLAPSLLQKDHYGNWIFSKDFDANQISEAICCLMGFTYKPSDKDYWNHGYSSESDFIFVTTKALTHDALKALSADVGSDRSLLVCCTAFNVASDAFNNLTLKKIPHTLNDQYDWDNDDYSLNLRNLPIGKGDASEDENV